MKKMFSALLILMLLFTVASCKETGVGNTPETGESTGVETHEANTEEVSDTDDSNFTAGPNDIISMMNNSYVYLSIDKMESAADVIAIVTYNGDRRLVKPDSTASETDLGKVFTYQNVTVDRVIKGNVGTDIDVRRVGGRMSKTDMLDSDDPKLENGGKYLLFLKETSLVNAEDTQSYKVLLGSSGCFKIDESGTLDTSILTDETDVTALLALYE